MLTHEEIRAVYAQGPEAVIAFIEPLCAQIAELRARVKELEDRLATKSHNSSKPPSSDSCTKQRRSLPQPSGRKSGGQPGHPGTTLHPVAVPDQTRLHEAEQCVTCGASPEGVACGASYGAGVKGMLTSLNQAHLLPFARSGEIVADLCGQPVSDGLLEAAVTGCTTALAATEASIKQGLARAAE